MFHTNMDLQLHRWEPMTLEPLCQPTPPCLISYNPIMIPIDNLHLHDSTPTAPPTPTTPLHCSNGSSLAAARARTALPSTTAPERRQTMPLPSSSHVTTPAAVMCSHHGGGESLYGLTQRIDHYRLLSLLVQLHVTQHTAHDLHLML